MAPAKRMLVVADAVGATQVISFLQPLSRAIASGEVSLHLETLGRTPEETLKLYDVARPAVFVMSRLTSRAVEPLIARARRDAIPVIFHLDDHLLQVPENLGASKFKAYNKPERLAGLRANMALADLVYASTTPLADALREHGVTTPIVSGAICTSVDPTTIPQPLPAADPVVGYMGTQGHAADLATILPVIETLLDDIPSLRFETFGTIHPPAGLERFGARVAHHAAVANYAGFLETLSSLGWWIGLAPLEDHPFNRCKTDTKWVEYAFAGVAPVTSDLPVYARACADGAGLVAGSPDEWRAAILSLLEAPARRAEFVARARAKLAASYGHAALEAQLSDVFAAAEQARLTKA